MLKSYDCVVKSVFYASVANGVVFVDGDEILAIQWENVIPDVTGEKKMTFNLRHWDIEQVDKLKNEKGFLVKSKRTTKEGNDDIQYYEISELKQR